MASSAWRSGKARGQTLVAGQARGPAVVLDEPLSFWGGFDAASGRVTDQRHPQVGRCLSDAILVMPAGRGSSSASSVLAEAIRAGTAPTGIIMSAPDTIVALGAVVAHELYSVACPVVVLSPVAFAELRDGEPLTIDANDTRAVVYRGEAP
jgi:predicted aconitase with swiveling domain